jgi:NAD(P)H-hydrate repair Nnr-like enzyme with NAD(P)H-hydrate dehydratase domain
MRAPSGIAAANLQSNAAQAVPGEADHLVRAMRAVLARQRPASAAEALQVLRRGYPDIPLSMRVAALSAAGK